MFADDLLIFSKADPATLRAIMDALESFKDTAGLSSNLAKSQVVLGGCSPSLHNICLQITGFQNSSFPLTCLGVPITASCLTKVECAGLVDKIQVRTNIWATRNISYAGRAKLINSVVFGLYTYWASIFVLPKAVTDQIVGICRNYLWGGRTEYSRPPYISWKNTCLPKSSGGLGIRDYGAWNKALMGKLIWAIAKKKDSLWVKWVNGRYLRGNSWWSYTPTADTSWHWKKLCKVKDLFKNGRDEQESWVWENWNSYSASKGYEWQFPQESKVGWAKMVWARPNLPRHAFIAWLIVQYRLPTKQRLTRLGQQTNTACNFCSMDDENENHLFFTCPYAQSLWKEIADWWSPMPVVQDSLQLIHQLRAPKGPSSLKKITSAVITAVIYHIWVARNKLVHKNQRTSEHLNVKRVKDQVRNRVLFLIRLLENTLCISIELMPRASGEGPVLSNAECL